MATLAGSRGSTKVKISSLEQMDLLSDLLPEQLNIIAERAQLFRFKRAQQIDITGAYFCFIIEGDVEVVPASGEDPATLVRASQIGTGGHFGSIWIKALKSKLHPLTPGSMAVLPSSFMRTIMNDWPELMENFARITENENNLLVLQLLVERAKLADTDRILGRIENVTNMLVQGGIGGAEIPQIVQHKFVIDKLPELQADIVEIEQGYLAPDPGIDEDRIRRVVKDGQFKYVRTRRVVSAGTRREFSDTLDSLTYEELVGKLVGRLIQKKRWTIACNGKLKVLDKLTIDQFIAPQKALDLMKGKYLLEISAGEENALTRFDLKKQLSLSGRIMDVSDNKEYSNKRLSI